MPSMTRSTECCVQYAVPVASAERLTRDSEARDDRVARSDAAVGAGTLSIGDLAARTGVSEGTLRMWETRHGFPVPTRLASGHRRYNELDVERIQVAVQAREDGLPLPMAIERAQRRGAEPRRSMYAALRERFDHLHPRPVARRTLLHISRAIEDECAGRAQRPLLLGCFQRARFFRQAEPRWRDLARTAEMTIVMADFKRVRRRPHGLVELPLAAEDPLLREWVLVCDAADLTACLVGWERPRDDGEPRRFELIWTVEPQVVREAARLLCELIAGRSPALIAGLRERLDEPPSAVVSGHLRATVELATRIAMYASNDE
jgi:MerR family transcriptional regulator, light-induced transcriptional regulator